MFHRRRYSGSLRAAIYNTVRRRTLSACVPILEVDGTVKSSTKIASGTGGGPLLANSDFFGSSVASVGDLDGDGVADLAVGARFDDTGAANSNRGAVHVLLLNAHGTVKSFTKIASGTGGGPVLTDGDFFGSSVTSVGDLDGDGVADIAVGAERDDTGGGTNSNRGAVHVLLLNADGTVKSSTKIASGAGGGPTLANNDLFGSSVAALGDLDGDGVADLAVGARTDDTGGSNRGAVHVLLLNIVAEIVARSIDDGRLNIIQVICLVYSLTNGTIMRTERIGNRYHITLDNGSVVSSTDYGRALDLAMDSIGRSAAIKSQQQWLTCLIISRIRFSAYDASYCLTSIADCKAALELALQS